MESLRTLVAILDAVDQGVHAVDKHGITVIYNKAASAIDGLAPEEVIGRPLLEVFPSLDEDSSTLLRVLRTGRGELVKQQTFTNYKGKSITTLNSTYPIVVNGKVTGACEVSTDITRIKEMAENMVDLRVDLRREIKKTGTRRLYTVDDIVGESILMKDIKDRILQVGGTESNVVVWGETGTGKELAVQSIHSASRRCAGPFVPQNCAALPESLLEGLVFGTAKGGFTGSVDRPGLLELASGGTLYLDEVDSMPPALQAKLLRVIQDKRVRRLGHAKEIPVDVRIVASTSLPPRQAVSIRVLRPDLYYRLSVVEIGLPPLRQRKEDIPLLCEHFMKKHSSRSRTASLSGQVMSAFLVYDWPGNVRELEHAVEGSLALAGGKLIDVEHIPAAVRGMIATASLFRHDSAATGASAGQAQNLPSGPSIQESWTVPLKEDMRLQERSAIQAALVSAGSISGAARILGMPRQTLQYRMKVLDIKKPWDRQKKS